VEIILGFNESWLQPEMLAKVQLAWRDFLGGLLAAPIGVLAYIPGTSSSSLRLPPTLIPVALPLHCLCNMLTQ